MDWITLLVEAAGVAIFLVWTVLPAREFREIYRRILARDAAAAAAAEAQRGREMEQVGDTGAGGTTRERN